MLTVSICMRNMDPISYQILGSYNQAPRTSAMECPIVQRIRCSVHELLHAQLFVSHIHEIELIPLSLTNQPSNREITWKLHRRNLSKQHVICAKSWPKWWRLWTSNFQATALCGTVDLLANNFINATCQSMRRPKYSKNTVYAVTYSRRRGHFGIVYWAEE